MNLLKRVPRRPELGHAEYIDIRYPTSVINLLRLTRDYSSASDTDTIVEVSLQAVRDAKLLLRDDYGYYKTTSTRQMIVFEIMKGDGQEQVGIHLTINLLTGRMEIIANEEHIGFTVILKVHRATVDWYEPQPSRARVWLNRLRRWFTPATYP